MKAAQEAAAAKAVEEAAAAKAAQEAAAAKAAQEAAAAKAAQEAAAAKEADAAEKARLKKEAAAAKAAEAKAKAAEAKAAEAARSKAERDAKAAASKSAAEKARAEKAAAKELEQLLKDLDYNKVDIKALKGAIKVAKNAGVVASAKVMINANMLLEKAKREEAAAKERAKFKADVVEEMKLEEENLEELNKNIITLLNIVRNKPAIRDKCELSTCSPDTDTIDNLKKSDDYKKIFKKTWDDIKNNNHPYKITNKEFYNGTHFFKGRFKQKPNYSINYLTCKENIDKFIDLMDKRTTTVEDMKQIGALIFWFTKNSMEQNQHFPPIWLTERYSPSSSSANSSSANSSPANSLSETDRPETPGAPRGFDSSKQDGSRKKTRGGSNRTLKKKKYSKR